MVKYRECFTVEGGRERRKPEGREGKETRGEGREELHVYKGTTPLLIHVGTHTPGDVLQCVYYCHQLLLVPCFPYSPPRHGTQARLIVQ